ncbi:PP_RS20740 family protein [Cereibacter sphaeroides]|uniref:PP_RS20740 family protein n=1 Tax=Cereibacter sphaeroides TaxID=1063 RepID=UPI0011AE1ABA|nr:hypothetical protein [Cereibacter sphaeroides]
MNQKVTTSDYEDDIDEDVLPEDVQPATPAKLDTLMPWHTPRKQYVREVQWRRYSERLIEKLAGGNGDRPEPIRYLTLPGIDFFDVEVLGRLAKGRGLDLEMTGFLADGKLPIQARAQFRMDSLIKTGIITDRSQTFPHRFEEIVHPNGQPARELQRRGPFHIVNVDACGSIALPGDKRSSRIIDAIFKLVDFQMQFSRTSWLLFVTTDARIGTVAPSVITAFLNAIRENGVRSTAFKSAAERDFSHLGGDLNSICNNHEFSQSDFLKLFVLGFSKWLLHNAELKHWNVTSLQAYCYGPTAGASNSELDCDWGASMPCLGFRFDYMPKPAVDLFSAAKTPEPVDSGHHERASLKALRASVDLVNLDTHLSSGSEAVSYAIRQRELLIGAGYEAAAVDEFSERYIS